jgi:hypothetical protein
MAHGNIPKQIHLDFEVDDLDEGERHVLSIGARKANYQPGGDIQSVPGPSRSPILSDKEK